MLKRFLIIILLVAPSGAFGQDFRVVNWDHIDFEVNSPTSKYYYAPLFDRYSKNDTTLTADDYFYLYYGYTTRDNYMPLLDDPNSDSLQMVFGNKKNIIDYNKIIYFAEKITSITPFSLRDLNVLAFAFDQVGRKEEAKVTIGKVNMLAQTIESTGNGLTAKTPWYVIYNNNCEDLLGYLGYNVSRKMIVSTEVVFLQVTNLPEKLKPYRGFYFNYAQIYKRKPTYLDQFAKPKRTMEFNPKYNPKSKLNTLPK